MRMTKDFSRESAIIIFNILESRYSYTMRVTSVFGEDCSI
jgi:hypothetical protein